MVEKYSYSERQLNLIKKKCSELEHSTEQYKEGLQNCELKLKKKANDLNRNTTDSQQLETQNESTRIALEAMTVKWKAAKQEREQLR